MQFSQFENDMNKEKILRLPPPATLRPSVDFLQIKSPNFPEKIITSQTNFPEKNDSIIVKKKTLTGRDAVR